MERLLGRSPCALLALASGFGADGAAIAPRARPRGPMVDEFPIEALCEAIGHRFSRPELLLEALSHRSFANEQPRVAPRDNERLEFLGDAVLGAAIAAMLFERYPEAPEGELTRRRADLVCTDSLAQLARGLAVGSHLRLGKGEERSGGRDKPRLLASALEAILGAVWADAGPAKAIEMVERLFEASIERASPGASDFKSRVQELLQRDRAITPTYRVTSVEGPDHERLFEVRMLAGEDELSSGHGRSKLEAEQNAARAALVSLEREGEAVEVASEES